MNNQPIETYTFSRALHLMRYGGKKMKPLQTKRPIVYIEVSIFGLAIVFEDFACEAELTAKEIMGEWVIVV